MDEVVKIAQAKAHFSELVARAEAGEEIVIARGNTAVAKIVPFGRRGPRKPGIAAHWRNDPAWKDLSDAVVAAHDEEDLAAAEGALSDAFGITLDTSSAQTGKAE